MAVAVEGCGLDSQFVILLVPVWVLSRSSNSPKIWTSGELQIDCIYTHLIILFLLYCSFFNSPVSLPSTLFQTIFSFFRSSHALFLFSSHPSVLLSSSFLPLFPAHRFFLSFSSSLLPSISHLLICFLLPSFAPSLSLFLFRFFFFSPVL